MHKILEANGKTIPCRYVVCALRKGRSAAALFVILGLPDRRRSRVGFASTAPDGLPWIGLRSSTDECDAMSSGIWVRRQERRGSARSVPRRALKRCLSSNPAKMEPSRARRRLTGSKDRTCYAVAEFEDWADKWAGARQSAHRDHWPRIHTHPGAEASCAALGLSRRRMNRPEEEPPLGVQGARTASGLPADGREPRHLTGGRSDRPVQDAALVKPLTPPAAVPAPAAGGTRWPTGSRG